MTIMSHKNRNKHETHVHCLGLSSRHSHPQRRKINLRLRRVNENFEETFGLFDVKALWVLINMKHSKNEKKKSIKSQTLYHICFGLDNAKLEC